MNLHKNFATLSHSKKHSFKKTFKLLLLKLKNYFAQRHNEIPALIKVITKYQLSALLELCLIAIGKNERDNEVQ
jgi:hypothetical protein